MQIDYGPTRTIHKCMAELTSDTQKLDWKLIRAFVAVMEEGTFSAAAKRLDASQPTLGRQIRLLEKHAGDVLFIRRGLRLEPTEAAQALLPHAQQVEREMDTLMRSVQAIGTDAAPRKITMTAPTLICDEMLPFVMPDLNACAPGTRFEIVPSDLLEDIHRRSVDIALRTVRPTQPELIIRKIAPIEIKLFASRAYVDRMGVPETPADLAKHDVVLAANDPKVALAMEQLGLDIDKLSVTAMSDDLRYRLACARAGLGIIGCHDWIGQYDPDLVPILPDLSLANLELWLVTTDDIRRSRTLRRVFDQLSDWPSMIESVSRAKQPSLTG